MVSRQPKVYARHVGLRCSALERASSDSSRIHYWRAEHQLADAQPFLLPIISKPSSVQLGNEKVYRYSITLLSVRQGYFHWSVVRAKWVSPVENRATRKEMKWKRKSYGYYEYYTAPVRLTQGQVSNWLLTGSWQLGKLLSHPTESQKLSYRLMASTKHLRQLPEALTFTSLTDKYLYPGWWDSIIGSSVFNSFLHITLPTGRRDTTCPITAEAPSRSSPAPIRFSFSWCLLV